VDSIAVHAVFWIACFAIASLFVLRAWHLGKGGLDEDGNIKNLPQYTSVEFWGVLGFGLVIFALLDLYFLFNPPAPSLR
jgi:uncharacterized membrane protein